MSNHNNQNNNQNPANNQNNNQNPAGQETKKLTMVDRAKHLKDKVMATKVGRTVVKVGKAAAITAVGIFGYELGKKSVKPTMVYVEPMKSEDVPEETAEEAPAEEEKETEQE